MLRLAGEQVESLFDEALPVEVRELPEDLARLDELLADPALLAPIERAWEESSRDHGRPTIAMASYVRLMVIKQRTGWGYETLVREVCDSLHLRRFCLLSLTSSVPHESTVRKLTGRLGPDVVAELTRVVIAKAQREARFRARAMRCDSTVVEADVRWPSDAGLALDGVRALAREGRRAAAAAGNGAKRIQDRSRAVAKRLRLIGRTVARRSGQSKATVLRLTGEAGELLRRSIREARKLAAQARRRARGRGAQAKLAAARRLSELAERAEKVARQIDQRLTGERITDRLVSLADPDARPIGKGKAGKALRVRLRLPARRADREHPPRGARFHLAPEDRGRLSERDRTSARHGGRAGAGGDRPERGRPRWRLRADHHESVAAGGRQRLHRRAPAASLTTNQAAAGPLPGRLRGTDQPPETRLRARTHAICGGERAPRPGPGGRCSPTTSTPSPSAPPETIPALQPSINHLTSGRATHPRRGRFAFSGLPGGNS